MAIDLSNHLTIRDNQEESSLFSALIFINNINIDATKNFDSYVILDSSSTITIEGNHGGFAGAIIIENELINVSSSTNSGGNTILTVQRADYDTVQATHISGELVYSVDFISETKSYEYNELCDVSDNDLFGVNNESGNATVVSDFLDWSNYSSSKIFDYKNSSKIFILEGINNQFIKTYEGYTTNKNPSAKDGIVNIEFSGEIDKIFTNEIGKVKTYKDEYIGAIIEDYFEDEYSISYVNMTEGELGTYKINYVSTGDFETEGEFLKYLASTSASRLHFRLNKTIHIFSNIYPTKVTSSTEIDENLVEIDQQGNDLLILNNFSGVYYEKSAYKNPELFEDNQYIRWLDYTDYTDTITIVEEKTPAPNQTFGFTAIEFEDLTTSKVNYGDYVLLVDNITSNEWWGKVLDITATKVTIQFGFDKVNRLNHFGRFTGTISTSDYRIYYVKDEMPYVWQYTRNINGEDEIGNLRTPIAPIVLDTDSSTTSISFVNENTLVVQGDYSEIGEYAKLDTEYVLISGKDYDDIETTLYIERAKLNSLKVISPTTFTPIKYSNILEIFDSFKFTNQDEKIYSGIIENADYILDTWRDNSTLEYNKEYQQEVPIYLYSNKMIQLDTSDSNKKKYTYDTFDNSDLEVLFESSSNTDYTFNSKIKNKNEVNLTSLESYEPTTVIGNSIEITSDEYSSINCGDVLSLVEIETTSDLYSTYLPLNTFKWTMLYKYIDTIPDNVVNAGSFVEDETYIIKTIGTTDWESIGASDSPAVGEIFVATGVGSGDGDAYDTYFKYYIILDFTYPDSINGTQFNFIKYDNTDCVILQELTVRGNPIMQVEQSFDEKDQTSIDIYGKRDYDISNNGLGLENFKNYLDHMKNNYKGTALNNTKSKISFKSICRLDIECLDIVTISDDLITGLDNQKVLIIGKKVQVSDGVRVESYIGVTIGNYTANSNNIILNKYNNYSPFKIPNYNHGSSNGDVGDNNPDSAQDVIKNIDGQLVSYTDSQYGILNLFEVDVSTFTAYVSSFDGDINGVGSLTIKDIAGDDVYKRIFTEAGSEGFIKLDGEFLAYVCTAKNTTLQIKTRGVFGTKLSDLFIDGQLQFFQTISQITKNGLKVTKIKIGEGENYLSYEPNGSFQLSTKEDSFLKLNYDSASDSYFHQIGNNLKDSEDADYSGFFVGDPTITNNNYIKFDQTDSKIRIASDDIIITGGSINISTNDSLIQFDDTHSIIELNTSGASTNYGLRINKGNSTGASAFLVGDNTNNKFIEFDGTTFTFGYDIIISGSSHNLATIENWADNGNDAYGYFDSGILASATKLPSDLTYIGVGSTIKLNEISAPDSYTGLYLGSSKMGYVNGDPAAIGNWNSYVDNTGKFQFKGDNNNYINWDSSNFNLVTGGTISISNGATTTLNALYFSPTVSTSYLSMNGGNQQIGRVSGLTDKDDFNGFYFGDTTIANNNYMYYDGNIVIAGDITITSGSYTGNPIAVAYTDADITGDNTSADATNYTGNSIAAAYTDATVGATWTDNLFLIPDRITDSATTGLNLTSTYLGYYDGANFISYIGSDGKFQFKGDANNYINWDGSDFNILTNGTVNISNDSNELNFETGAGDSSLKMNIDGSHYQQQIGAGLSDSIEASYAGYFFGDPTISNKNFFKYNQDDNSSMFAGKYFNETAYVDTKEEFISALDVTKAYDGYGDIISGSFVVGKKYEITLVGTTDFTLIGASANTLGIVFTATGVGSGTGTAEGINEFKFVNTHSLKVQKIVIINNIDITGLNVNHFSTEDNEIIINSDISKIEGQSSQANSYLSIDFDNFALTFEYSIGVENLQINNLGKTDATEEGSGELLDSTSKIYAIKIKSENVYLKNIEFNGVYSKIYTIFGTSVYEELAKTPVFDNVNIINIDTSFKSEYLFYKMNNLKHIKVIQHLKIYSNLYLFGYCNNISDFVFTDYDVGGAVAQNLDGLSVFEFCDNISNIFIYIQNRFSAFARDSYNITNGYVRGSSGINMARCSRISNIIFERGMNSTSSLILLNISSINNCDDGDYTLDKVSVIDNDNSNNWNKVWNTYTTTTTLASHEDKVVVTTTSSPTIITLPTIQVGREYTIANTSANDITIAFSSGTLAIGSPTITAGAISKYIYDGAVWYRLTSEAPIVYTGKAFATEWTVSGDATARTITLPLIDTRTEGTLSYNCTIDWGDGTADSTVTTYDDADRIHTYANDGVYQVEITGTMEGWSFNNGGDKLKITKVLSFGGADFDGFKYLKFGFYGCTNLTSLGTKPIPASGTGLLTNGFDSTFSSCTSLTSIPTDLFRYNTAVSTYGFNYTFKGCISLTTLPTDLFRYNTTVSTAGFYNTFSNCTSLTTLPTDLFRYNTTVSTYGFYNTFSNCTSLTTLPADLFRYNTAVSTYGFYNTFKDCISLTTLPTDLFGYNTAVSIYGFHSTFKGCSALLTVPVGLFKYNTATGNGSFDETFNNCVKLQLHTQIFCLTGEESTRFLNLSPDFEDCFELDTAFTGTQGTAPELWNFTYGTGTPTTTDCFNGQSTSSVDNYADIPTAWGGA